jgi:phosphonate transport system substrate-binding protein
MAYLKSVKDSCMAVLLTTIVLNTWGACLGDKASTQVMSVSIVPQLSHSIMYSKWAPILEHVGQKTGQCFNLEIPDTIGAFEKSLLNGEPDFAFANPYHQVIAKNRKGYTPLLIDGKTRLTGILVVKTDSSIKSNRQLHGREIAFPSPNAFAASLLIRAELAK